MGWSKQERGCYGLENNWRVEKWREQRENCWRKLGCALHRGRHSTLKCKLYEGGDFLVFIAASSAPRIEPGTQVFNAALFPKGLV